MSGLSSLDASSDHSDSYTISDEVPPPIFDAAIPVLAVIETTDVFLEYFFLRAEMMARSNRDFPEPMRKTTS